MAGKVKDHRAFSKCPRCMKYLERMEVAGDEREVVVVFVCMSCGFECGEHVEAKGKK